MALGNLKVTLELVADQFVSGVRTAQKEIDGLGRSLQDPAVKDGMQNIGKGLVAAGTAISVAGLAIAAGLTKAAAMAANYGDEMLAMSRKTGISGQSLAGYKLLAEQSGTSLTQLGTGLNALSKNMLTAATSTGTQSRLFAALGIAVKDAGGNLRSTSDILPQIADKFKGMEDGALKNALAAQLFGRAVGPDLIAFLSEGSAGMDSAKEAAAKYGLVLTDVELIASNKFKASQAELRLALEGLAVSIGISLVPALTSLIDKANEYIAVASQWAKANPEITAGLGYLSLALMGSGGIVAGLGLVVGLLPSVVEGMKLLGITSVAGLGGAAASAGIYTAAVLALVASLWAAYDVGQQLRNQGTIDTSAGGTAKRVLGGSTNVGLAYMAYQALRAPSVPMPDFGGVKGGSSSLSAGAPGSDAALRKILADLQKPDKKKSAEQTVLDQMRSSLGREGSKASALEQVLNEASSPKNSFAETIEPAFKLADVLDRLGPAIADVADEFRKSGQPMPEIISYYEAMRKNALALTEQDKQLAEANAELNRVIFEGQKNIAKSAAELSKLTEVKIDDPGAQLKRAQDVIRDNPARRLFDMQQDIADTAAKMEMLRESGLSVAQVEAAVGASFEGVSERAKELGVVLSSTFESMTRTDELSRAWGHSLGQVSDRLVDMIVDMDFSFKRLKDIGLDTAKSLATSFLDGFFKPFKDQLAGMGKEAGKWLGELAFGKTGGGGGGGGGGDKGLFGGLLGAFGGLFGGKGDKNSPFGDPTAGVWNPHGGSGGGLLGKLGLGNAFGGAGGAATGLMGSLNPISAGLGIANGAFDLASKITGKIGSGRDSANEIVKSQNSFVNQTLAGILSDPDLSPTNKLKMVNNAWDAYQANLGNYGASGGENAVTSNQAFATVAPLVSQIKSDLIKGGATDSTGAEGGTYNITVNITTTDEIRNVEDLIHIIKFNKGGATTEMTKAVINMEGAITAR
jgi:TP901 family phage tail tape measure protein